MFRIHVDRSTGLTNGKIYRVLLEKESIAKRHSSTSDNLKINSISTKISPGIFFFFFFKFRELGKNSQENFENREG